ncbi:MAG: glycosyltransferase family 1 protein [Kineothrix sp.]
MEKVMEKPVRVLHVLGGLSLGGAESRIMELYRCMDRERVQFDFLLHQKEEGERVPEFYDEEVRRLGGNIYTLPKFRLYNYLRYKKAVRNFFREHHEFAVVQGHMTSTAAIYLSQAGRAGVPVLAAHARSAGVDKGMKGRLTRLLRLPLLGCADYCFACSGEAGEAVFGRRWKDSPKALVLPNAVDTDRFAFDQEARERIRRKLGIGDCTVIGHVGRFHYAKNHEYLTEVFALLHQRLEAAGRRAVLLLLGEGSGRERVEEQVKGLGLSGQVLFLGNQKEVRDYYQAMDYFVFPSRFEGLPGTVVEAQAAGLRCIISDRITPEVGISSLVHFESISRPPQVWADYILRHLSYERKDGSGMVKAAGFDVREQALQMERFYLTGKIKRE